MKIHVKFTSEQVLPTIMEVLNCEETRKLCRSQLWHSLFNYSLRRQLLQVVCEAHFCAGLITAGLNACKISELPYVLK